MDLVPGRDFVFQKVPNGVLPTNMDKQSLGHVSTVRVLIIYLSVVIKMTTRYGS